MGCCVQRIGLVLPGRELAEGTPAFQTLVDGIAAGHRRIEVRRPTPPDAAAAVRELLSVPVDLLIEHGSAHGARAAADGSSRVPVILWSPQPVATGLVSDLERPGGSVTGITFVAGRVRSVLELLATVLPDVRRCAVLVNLDYPPSPAMLEDALAAAPHVGLQLERFDVPELVRLDDVFARIASDGCGAAYVQNHPIFNRPDGAALIASLGLRHRIPVVSHYESVVRAGGLVGTPPDFVHWATRAAAYADLILRGAPAGELPFEQSVPQRVLVNVMTADRLGVAIPETLEETMEAVQ